MYKGASIQGLETCSSSHGEEKEGGVGESDGSCHNIPSTNHPPNFLISRLRFKNNNENRNDVDVDDRNDEDNVYLQL